MQDKATKSTFPATFPLTDIIAASCLENGLVLYPGAKGTVRASLSLLSWELMKSAGGRVEWGSHAYCSAIHGHGRGTGLSRSDAGKGGRCRNRGVCALSYRNHQNHRTPSSAEVGFSSLFVGTGNWHEAAVRDCPPRRVWRSVRGLAPIVSPVRSAPSPLLLLDKQELKRRKKAKQSKRWIPAHP